MLKLIPAAAIAIGVLLGTAQAMPVSQSSMPAKEGNASAVQNAQYGNYGYGRSRNGYSNYRDRYRSHSYSRYRAPSYGGYRDPSYGGYRAPSYGGYGRYGSTY